jgi:beta-lactam-binding protein with PASTA domain
LGMGRREVLTVVPKLVGLAVRVAQDVALDAQLLAVDQAPQPSRTATGIVTAQDPPPGSYLPLGSRVRIWVSTDPDDGDERGGRGGLRLPTGPITVTPSGTK